MLHRRPTRTATPAEVMDATLGAITIGLVPIMSRLHDGHLSLIRRSHAENDDTIVALVDPSGSSLDLTENDVRDVAEAGASVSYVPTQETIFPDGFATSVNVASLTDCWEGASRPGHLDRVTTLVTILLNQLQPTRTYLGEKHLQQLAIIKRVHDDLALSGEILACPTVRDPDGLPLSSYNASLTADERAAALAIPTALFAIQEQAREGESDPGVLIATGREIVDNRQDVSLDYLAIVDPATFEPSDAVETGNHAIVAGTVGSVRIIDTIHLQHGEEHQEAQ